MNHHGNGNNLSMKTVFLSYLIFITFYSFAQTDEAFKKDTVNFIDENNKKQGLWIRYSADKKRIIEKGYYLDGHKNGLWTTFYSSGRVKHEITYKEGKPIGPARFYYKSGKLSEEGYWNINHWEGQYRFYHPNGKLAYDWSYDKKGKRTGEQKYFYENGNIKYSGVWKEGKTTGALKMYNDSGLLVSERIYENGKFARSINTQNKDTFKMPAGHSKRWAHFTGTGNHTVYNLAGKIEKKGFFVKGELFNGEQYIYGNHDELIEKIIIRNGRVEQTLIVEK